MPLERTHLALKCQRVRLVALALLGIIVISATALVLETLYPSDTAKVRLRWERHSVPPGMRGFFFWKTSTDGSWACAIRIGNTGWELDRSREH